MTEVDEQGGDEEIATCHMCGQTFSTQVELSQHLMDAHDDNGLPVPASLMESVRPVAKVLGLGE